MDIESRVREIFAEVFPTMSSEELDWNKKQKSYENWDSFAHLQLLTLTEERFNITLSVDESTSIDSAQKLLECIRSHV
jgi:acyl carrier protein